MFLIFCREGFIIGKLEEIMIYSYLVDDFL